MSSTVDPRHQSIGELLKQLSQETSTLVRQELELARAEVEQQGRRAGVGAGMLGSAGVAARSARGAHRHGGAGPPASRRGASCRVRIHL